MIPRTERQPRVQDIEAVIGLLAVLEGEISSQQSDSLEIDVGRLRDRLARVDLLGPGADATDTAPALGRVNQRLRFVVGEYETEDEDEGVS